MTLIWFIYAAWLLLIVYLTVQAIGVKRDTEPHLLQSFGLMFAMIAAFLLPRACRCSASSTSLPSTQPWAASAR
ncbi:hypothetical protein FJ420_27670 [Mesorhizobium sp. B3-1-3]|uniref:hypothetical protein n=1 Tax=unclassified Mesorhizobium TaxID=325217 RepID=UPI00112D844A|nr:MULTISPECIES: hypothetical protein [unclassified Mesorhizobium]TPI62179.1 hypothetical protein FJ424_21380 [Mesorhizobium sp. B3-1-8]TPI64177.1 hypothetical protein FJ420_27670 [Mesorhizobium sp. B3-1-3]